MSEQSTIRWDQDADGIVVLTLDDPNQSANTMNAAYLKSMRATVDRLVKEKDTLTGVILTSAKKTFFAGGDLKDLLKVRKEDARQSFELGQEIKAQLRALETLGKPVVAAINGAALGGGLEIALACHRRIIADVKGAQVGLPEVTLGLLPGGGGVVRTVRMLGIVDALMKVLLQGQRYRPQEAKEAGLVHEVVDSVEALLPAAKAWVKANPTAQQPWDQKGYKIPGGTPSSPGLAANLPAFPANLRKQLKGANMPAPRAIMATAVESTQVDVDTAFTVESRYFTELVTGQVAKNMIQAFFFDMQHINSGGGRPKDYPQYTAKKVGVLGAGMMGAGIAYVCAKAGIDVVLKDVSLASAEKGKQYSVKLVEKAIQRGKSTKEKGDALLARITPTTDAADLKGCDLVIEAVFEDVKLKHQVFQEVQDVVAPDAVLGSNTSTLPISVLAEGVKRAEDFVGMHFFSPVDKMPLLELIAGKKTSDATLAKAIDIAVQIGKTPIVVNDSRGFFTSRVIGTFLNEAIAMVGEGLSPASIEQAGLQAGYPAAPLQLVDELTLTLPRKIRQETKAATLAEGKPWVEHSSYAVVDALVDQHQRKGRSTGGGFYDYVDGKRTGLWAGLARHFTRPGHTIPFEDMKERMLFAEAIDTVRCFDEGVLRSAADANIGSILGIGFPAWTGGVVQFINGYEGRTGNGLRGFIARARELAQRYGAHFEPPASLIEKAERGELLK
ncbi:enoyl-CoA hydratase/isomerase family protein [Myxococcus sp. AM009]|uniref:3-hydroxyacyl-CoA dehydrogenase NAD-binding domain-containing protein n=1 Tax=unclassified Myxococcus TaxID=2648731 RepID=UPI001595D0BA|nr:MULTISPECIES: 3-hydroxyacyl-CoA dehydrogenase NAD-binding domain-containing protein [unclassified Myxococcus]NVJ01124.1 enoyl-CoA hydratase/isomerase family protein [Myxococcus sp. AM009]NVJ16418.1 enoyl-CoA hydratase/isomerase family protein [Myxococcus sp. AM010]